MENQVLDSSILLTPSSCSDLSPSDMEASLPIEDPAIEEGSEVEDSDDEDTFSLDGSIAKELEDLMSKLSEASSVEYRLSSTNRVVSDVVDQSYPSYLLYEDLQDFEPETAHQY